MKIIIDIPEELYKASQTIEVKHEDVIQIPLEVIANGIIYEELKNKKSKWNWDPFADTSSFICKNCGGGNILPTKFCPHCGLMCIDER
jgi:rubrerythrin